MHALGCDEIRALGARRLIGSGGVKDIYRCAEAMLAWCGARVFFGEGKTENDGHTKNRKALS